MKFHWGDYLFGCWVILFIEYMVPGCYGDVRWALWVLPFLIVIFWILERNR